MNILSNLLILSKKSRDVSSLLTERGIALNAIERTINATGISQLSYFPNQDFDSILNKSRQALKNHSDEFTKKIKVLVVVSQTNFGTIPNGAARLQSILDLSTETICFEIVEGCNGFVKALKLIESLLSVGDTGAIFGGEFGSQMVDGSEPGTAALFGDGFSFTLVEKTGSFKSFIRNDGKRGDFIRFNFKEPTLHMDGFNVFQFTIKEVPQLVREFGNLIVEENTLVALHQASKLVVEEIASRIGVEKTQYEIFSASSFGNLGAASIPGFIAKYGEINLGTKIYCIGFGSGLSWGICEIEWQGKRNEVVYV